MEKYTFACDIRGQPAAPGHFSENHLNKKLPLLVVQFWQSYDVLNDKRKMAQALEQNRIQFSQRPKPSTKCKYHRASFSFLAQSIFTDVSHSNADFWEFYNIQYSIVYLKVFLPREVLSLA